MATTKGRAIFLDTNILLRANVAEAPLHQEALAAIRHLRSDNELWISRQVLREYIATLTRPQKFANPRSAAVIIERVQYFQKRFHVADEGAQVTNNLLDLLDHVQMGGKQIHDANIIATMQANAITHLLTHNPSDFDRFAEYVTVMPLDDVVSQMTSKR